MSEISKLSDAGTPAVTKMPDDHLVKQTYLNICSAVHKELLKPKVKIGAFYSTAERLVIV